MTMNDTEAGGISLRHYANAFASGKQEQKKKAAEAAFD